MAPFVLSRTLGYAVNRCAAILRGELQARFFAAGHNITPEEWAILAVLWDEDGLAQGDIAERTIKDKTTVTRFIDRLERKRLVKRMKNQIDKRVSNVRLTAAGSALSAKLVPIAQAFLDECGRLASVQDLRTTLRTLQKINQSLGQDL